MQIQGFHSCTIYIYQYVMSYYCNVCFCSGDGFSLRGRTTSRRSILPGDRDDGECSFILYNSCSRLNTIPTETIMQLVHSFTCIAVILKATSIVNFPVVYCNDYYMNYKEIGLYWYDLSLPQAVNCFPNGKANYHEFGKEMYGYGDYFTTCLKYLLTKFKILDMPRKKMVFICNWNYIIL